MKNEVNGKKLLCWKGLFLISIHDPGSCSSSLVFVNEAFKNRFESPQGQNASPTLHHFAASQWYSAELYKVLRSVREQPNFCFKLC